MIKTKVHIYNEYDFKTNGTNYESFLFENVCPTYRKSLVQIPAQDKIFHMGNFHKYNGHLNNGIIIYWTSDNAYVIVLKLRPLLTINGGLQERVG